MLLIQEQLSLNANKVLEFVCTVIRTVELLPTVEFYTGTILLSEGFELNI